MLRYGQFFADNVQIWLMRHQYYAPLLFLEFLNVLQPIVVLTLRLPEALVLRQQSAEVRLKIREKAVVHNIDAALTKFERYQQKIDHIEAQVDSYDLTEIQDLSMQISSLAQNDTIEAELATMKQKVVNN